MRLLVVEDEKKVAAFIKQGMEEEGFTVDVALDGETGLRMALEEVHDVIILDVRLPQMNGLEMLGELRRQGLAVSVLLLSAGATVEDKTLGLGWGADDYLAKPFVFQELVDRVRALARRRATSKASTSSGFTILPES